MKNPRIHLGITSFVVFVIAAGYSFVPDPADAAGGAMFRVLRSFHGNQQQTAGGESYSDPFTNMRSEPWPGHTIDGQPYGPTYPPATAVFTPNGGFSIPRHVIHWGTAELDGYTFSCVPGTCAPGYPKSIYYYSYYNQKGIFSPNHPNAPTGTAAVTIRKTVTSPGFTTTQFNDAYAFGRVGSMKVTPGPNKFGGTMRYFYGLNSRWYQLVTNVYPCCEVFYGHAWRTGMTPYGQPSGMMDVTEYDLMELAGTYINFAGTRAHTYLTTGGGTPNDPGPYITRQSHYFWSTAPWTTGMITGFQSGGNYISTAVQTGSDNRTENREMGTLSLVTSHLTHSYINSFNPSEPVTSPFHNVRVWKMRVTFLPEPGGILLVGAGILGLAGVYRLRRR